MPYLHPTHQCLIQVSPEGEVNSGGYIPRRENSASLMATISCSKTFAKRRAIFLSVRKTVNIQGYFKLREPIKTRENCYLIW